MIKAYFCSASCFFKATVLQCMWYRFIMFLLVRSEFRKQHTRSASIRIFLCFISFEINYKLMAITLNVIIHEVPNCSIGFSSLMKSKLQQIFFAYCPDCTLAKSIEYRWVHHKTYGKSVADLLNK